MITIPVWVFVLLIIFASITALLLLLMLIVALYSIFALVDEYEATNCPEYIEEDDPDYNPEHIPTVEREKD